MKAIIGILIPSIHYIGDIIGEAKVFYIDIMLNVIYFEQDLIKMTSAQSKI